MNDKQIKFIQEISADMRDFGILDHVADWIGCQFALESNFGNSRIAKTKNNLCGMKVPLLRPSTNVACEGFSHYPSKYFCEIDYVLWLAYNRFSGHDLTNLEHFTMHLKAQKYCPDLDYIERINNLYQQFKNSTK